jgi:hypothetical protein
MVSSSQDSIFSAALGLPPESRAVLADLLLGSLESPEDEAVLDENWREVQRRRTAWQKGETTAYSREEVLSPYLKRPAE